MVEFLVEVYLLDYVDRENSGSILNETLLSDLNLNYLQYEKKAFNLFLTLVLLYSIQLYATLHFSHLNWTRLGST